MHACSYSAYIVFISCILAYSLYGALFEKKTSYGRSLLKTQDRQICKVYNNMTQKHTFPAWDL